MSAGLTHKQIYDRIYRRLNKLQGIAAKNGINLRYADGALWSNVDNTMVAWFNISKASNGEVFGDLRVSDAHQHGTFD